MTSLLSIKSRSEKAYDLLQSKTIQKHICMDSSDRMGSNITFILEKERGRILLTFHKKRSFLCSVIFQSNNKQILDQVNYKSESLNSLLVEILMYKFPFICRNYIKNGMRKKASIVRKFARDLTPYNLKIHFEINNKCIVNL